MFRFKFPQFAQIGKLIDDVRDIIKILMKEERYSTYEDDIEYHVYKIIKDYFISNSHNGT